ncbi:MAG: YraN family protein [Phycisphaerales bacterium]
MRRRRAGEPRIPAGTPWTARVRLWLHELRHGTRLSSTRVLGFVGEDTAARTLRRAGYRLLARNVLTKEGEADLVMCAPDGRTRVIVEVKTRRVELDGAVSAYPPERSVHAEKRRKLAAIARQIATLNAWGEDPVRIDVVAIDWPIGVRNGTRGASPAPVVRHWKDAVR